MPDPDQILADSNLHKRLHQQSASYHLAVVYFHLRKMEDPLCQERLPGLNPNVNLTQAKLDYIREKLQLLGPE